MTEAELRTLAKEVLAQYYKNKRKDTWIRGSVDARSSACILGQKICHARKYEVLWASA